MNKQITKGEIYSFVLDFGFNGQETEQYCNAAQDIILSKSPKLSSYLFIAAFLKCSLIS